MGLHNKDRVLIAATSSGSGKTLLTCGILEIMKQLNKNPVSFKCGPDYIDPMFHRNVLGVNGSNLDSFFSAPDELRDIVDSSQGGIAIIEGVMGIYDGSGVDSYEGSCYSVAKAIQAPVILVVDAKGLGRTVISLIKGILLDDDSRLIKGIILNRMTENYFSKIKDVLEYEIHKTRSDIEILGFVPKIDGINLDSRHLGLKMPEEIADIKEQICKVADSIRKNCDIEKILEIASHDKVDISAKETGAALVDIKQKNNSINLENCDCSKNSVNITKSAMHTNTVDINLAVARDDAFCFYYKENIELLEKLGVKIKYFSPINDKEVPEADGLLLGGGYPELHLKQLSGNESMLKSIRLAMDKGIPTLAECGGFMYLHDSIKNQLEQEFKMVGAIQGSCFYTGHLVRFGYVTLQIAEDDHTQAHKAIDGMKGHEFHYYDSTNNGDSCIATKPDGLKQWPCMISDGISCMGFPHLYYNSNPEFIQKFVENMRKYHEQYK